MKFTKIFAGLVVAGVLAGCSTASDMASSAASAVTNTASSAASAVSNTASGAMSAVKDTASAAVSKMTPSKPVFETAAYFCDVQGKKNQVVSVTYSFIDGKADTATVSIHRKVVGAEMKLDTAYQDGVRFVDGNKIWSLDYGFSAATVGKTVPVMFTNNNKILAKNCDIAK